MFFLTLPLISDEHSINKSLETNWLGVWNILKNCDALNIHSHLSASILSLVMRPSPTWISNIKNVNRKKSDFTWTKFYTIKCFKRSLSRCNWISLRHSQLGPRYSECWQWAFLWYTMLKVIANIQCLLTSCQEEEKCRCKNKKKYLEPEASTHRRNYINTSLECFKS